MANIDALFEQLVARGGSDLHFSCGRKPVIRESGVIVALDLPVPDNQTVSQYILEIMPETNRRAFEERNDTDFVYEKAGLGRFRTNVFRDHAGMGGVFRVIPPKILSTEELNLPTVVTDLCHLSKGLIVVTGPTGSGKSTTLAAMIDYVNRTRTDHIITIEDPIEFVHQDKKGLINQREVHNHTHSFAAALRAALREDPDVLLLGEMRDRETLEIALHTAESGHLVFGTLHTNTAVSTVERIVDAFPVDRQNQIRTMLASSLKGVVAQTLCKRKPRGRVAALEILIVTHGISATIRDNKIGQIPAAMQIGGAQGMLLLNDALTKLVREGVVEPQQAYDKAVDKEDLVAKLKKIGCEIPWTEIRSQAAVVVSKPPAKATEPARIDQAATRIEKPPVVASPAPTEPVPNAELPKISSTLTICGEPFLCCPLQQVALTEEASVYVVLGVDEWGSWKVVDVGQTDQAGDEEQGAERQRNWVAQCPSRNLWFGLHGIRGSLTVHRHALEDRIRVEYKLRATQRPPPRSQRKESAK